MVKMVSGERKQVAIVTGSNTGIGREAALSLAKDGMKVFMACRSADKGHEAASYIREEKFHCTEYEFAGMSRSRCRSVDAGFEDIRVCAKVCIGLQSSQSTFEALLINHAGVNDRTPWYTTEGVGGSAQVNYLGPYVLTRLLEESLVAGAPSRVVNVSSIIHREAKIPDPDKFLKDFEAGSYHESKLANVLFTFELQRRWQGKRIQACAVDPGGVFSDIWRTSRYRNPPLVWGLKVVFAPTWDGATPVYHAATTPLEAAQDTTPLRYFARGGFAWWGVTKPTWTPIVAASSALLDWSVRYLSRGLFFSKVVEVPANPQAYDEKLASKLWSLSADIAGLSD